ncbi:hypothetical protein GDO81_009454 [Engystomops pustulosus]|uniref:Uncharacterized protein n=1 Tax=Engystomops pustulosus TaxID=76066 RepID=A0AAV7BSG4_ENGPU|nr:hypothetical protein GDO81_009454 [Engystomops pustulosus]
MDDTLFNWSGPYKSPEHMAQFVIPEYKVLSNWGKKFFFIQILTLGGPYLSLLPGYVSKCCNSQSLATAVRHLSQETETIGDQELWRAMAEASISLPTWIGSAIFFSPCRTTTFNSALLKTTIQSLVPNSQVHAP